MVARCLPAFKAPVSLITPSPAPRHLTCVLFFSAALTPLPSFSALYLSDSLSPSCISCWVFYVHLGSPIETTLTEETEEEKTTRHLNEVTRIPNWLAGKWVAPPFPDSRHPPPPTSPQQTRRFFLMWPLFPSVPFHWLLQRPVYL